jgi:hypothetical protein
MPQTIRPTRAPASDDLSGLRSDVAELRQLVHSLVRNSQPIQNPSPQGGSEGLLLQLLLDERTRAEKRDAELRQLSNPLHQLDQLQALAELVNPVQTDDNMLQGALEALGGVIAAGMEHKEQTEGSAAPDHADAPNGADEP